SGPQTILCREGKEAPAILLTLEQAQNQQGVTEKETGRVGYKECVSEQALVVRRHVPVLQDLVPDSVRSPIPFFPEGCLVLTDHPALLGGMEHLPDDLVVFSVVPVTAHEKDWIALSSVTPDSVKEALVRAGRAFKHVRVLTNLSKAAPAPA